MSNLMVNGSIPADVVTACSTQLSEVSRLLQPYLQSLSNTERQALPKMGDKTVAFVDKVVDYCESNPAFMPSFLQKEALLKDVNMFKQLLPLYRAVEQLASHLDDTILQAGSLAFQKALMYHNSVKVAAKSAQPHSKEVYQDLSMRFPGKSKKKSMQTTA